MHTHVYLLAIFAPSVICAPLPAPKSQLSARQPIPFSFFDSNLKAAITYERALGRETSSSDALAEEKRAYELEVLRGNVDSVVLKSRSAQVRGADAAVAEFQAVEVAVEQETKTDERLPVNPLDDGGSSTRGRE